MRACGKKEREPKHFTTIEYSNQREIVVCMSTTAAVVWKKCVRGPLQRHHHYTTTPQQQEDSINWYCWFPSTIALADF